jgi:hypothetical protein
LLGPFVLGAAVLAIGTTVVAYPLVYLVVARWRNPERPPPPSAPPVARTPEHGA